MSMKKNTRSDCRGAARSNIGSHSIQRGFSWLVSYLASSLARFQLTRSCLFTVRHVNTCQDQGHGHEFYNVTLKLYGCHWENICFTPNSLCVCNCCQPVKTEQSKQFCFLNGSVLFFNSNVLMLSDIKKKKKKFRLVLVSAVKQCKCLNQPSWPKNTQREQHRFHYFTFCPTRTPIQLLALQQW